MPQVTVYVRAEDKDKWRNLKGKAELVAFALSLTDEEKKLILKFRKQKEQK